MESMLVKIRIHFDNIFPAPNKTWDDYTKRYAAIIGIPVWFHASEEMPQIVNFQEPDISNFSPLYIPLFASFPPIFFIFSMFPPHFSLFPPYFQLVMMQCSGIPARFHASEEMPHMFNFASPGPGCQQPDKRPRNDASPPASRGANSPF